MSWRAVWQLIAVFSTVFVMQADAKPIAGERGGVASHARLLDALVASYPDFLRAHNGKSLTWKDGSTMLFDDGKRKKSFDRLLNSPDLEDQFHSVYHAGNKGLSPSKNTDPGRIRFQPFFTKMYGDCRKRQVAGKLREIVWLPRHDGRKITVTKVNDIAGALEKISHELDSLIDRQPRMKIFVSPMSGTYKCRRIAGTKRYSVHAYGAAIDINVKQSHYWRWSKPGKDGLYAWRNKIPLEIVEIFEQHGFIWGGKWYHYDTMHFEYRPELLAGSRAIAGNGAKN